MYTQRRQKSPKLCTTARTHSDTSLFLFLFGSSFLFHFLLGEGLHSQIFFFLPYPPALSFSLLFLSFTFSLSFPSLSSSSHSSSLLSPLFPSFHDPDALLVGSSSTDNLSSGPVGCYRGGRHGNNPRGNGSSPRWLHALPVVTTAEVLLLCPPIPSPPLSLSLSTSCFALLCFVLSLLLSLLLSVSSSSLFLSLWLCCLSISLSLSACSSQLFIFRDN